MRREEREYQEGRCKNRRKDDNAWLASLVPNDVEVLIVRRSLEINRDCIEFRIRCPGGPGGQLCTSLLQLALADTVGNINEVKLVLHSDSLDYLPKPLTLSPRVPPKVQNDGRPSRQHLTNVRG